MATRRRCAARLVLGALTVALVASLVPSRSSARPSPRPRTLGPFGKGADQVWVLVPAVRIRFVVVLAHGWKDQRQATPTAWLDQFAPWTTYLLAEGGAVIFPRYQSGPNDPSDRRRTVSFRAGVREGFRHLPTRPLPVIAVGYSFGAALATAYASNAESWHLPLPAALDAIFPALPIPGVPVVPVRADMRAITQAGDRDTVAGYVGADAVWRWLRPLPRSAKRYLVVRSHGAFVADHRAPTGASAAAQAAFWLPLDRLVAAVVPATG